MLNDLKYPALLATFMFSQVRMNTQLFLRILPPLVRHPPSSCSCPLTLRYFLKGKVMGTFVLNYIKCCRVTSTSIVSFLFQIIMLSNCHAASWTPVHLTKLPQIKMYLLGHFSKYWLDDEF